MGLVIFVGGIIVGMLISILVFVLTYRYNSEIQNAQVALKKSVQPKAYIVGLSEEEQSTAESIKAAHSKGIDYKVK